MESYKDYLIIISPPDEVVKVIAKYKQASINKIGQFEGMNSRAHISISHHVRSKSFMAQPFFNQLEKRLLTMQPVELHINGFDFFKHGEVAFTIYAVINAASPNDNWFKLLNRQTGMKLKNFVPHITIARNIPPSAFKVLWPYFEKAEYKAAFMAHSLTVLSRETFSDCNGWPFKRELFFGNRLMPF